MVLAGRGVSQERLGKKHFTVQEAVRKPMKSAKSAGGMYLGEGDYSSFRQLLGRGNTLMVVLVGIIHFL